MKKLKLGVSVVLLALITYVCIDFLSFSGCALFKGRVSEEVGREYAANGRCRLIAIMLEESAMDHPDPLDSSALVRDVKARLQLEDARGDGENRGALPTSRFYPVRSPIGDLFAIVGQPDRYGMVWGVTYEGAIVKIQQSNISPAE